MFRQYALHLDDPAILAGRRPGGEIGAPADAEHLADVGEGGREILEEHDAEAREQPVIWRAVERGAAGIGVEEAQVARPARALPGGGEQRLRDIDAERLTLRADRPGDRDRRGAAAAADID